MDHDSIKVLCLVLTAFPHDDQCSGRFLVAVEHQTANSKDLSIMTPRFLLRVICQHGVCDLDYFLLDVLAYMNLH